MNRRVGPAIGAVVLPLLLIGAVTAGRPAVPTPSPGRGRDVVETDAALAVGNDLGELVNGGRVFRGADLVIQGRVTAARAYQVPLANLPTAPAWKASGNLLDRTDYTIEVSEAVVGTGPTGPLTLTVPSAIRDGKIYALEGAPILDVGQEYVLLLIARPDGKYNAVGPQGFLQVTGGQIEPVESASKGWPVLGELRGKAAGEVKQQLKDKKRR